jgi:hypothetical protein
VNRFAAGSRRAIGSRARVAMLLLVLGLASCTDSTPDVPSEGARRAYAVLMAYRVSGAPTAEQLEALRPFLSDTLYSLLAAANRMRDEELRQFPGDKPAFAEGDLFSSLFEGPTSFEAVEEAGAEPGRVRMEFVYEADGSRSTWSDVAIMVMEGDRWVLGDVEYQGDWDFALRGTLRAGLEEALVQ